ncbi:MAG TPA: M48 family metalloprotease [Casimicrobiaceae bacterium]|nr:M48 family metalloprotease [Casimicrobiaceae bacterium]
MLARLPHSVRKRLIAAAAGVALVAQPLAPATIDVGLAHAQSSETPATPAQAKSGTGGTYSGSTVPEKSGSGIFSGSGLPTSPATSPPGHQGLPDLGDESLTLATPGQERKLGESVVRQIRASGAYLDDPEVNDYLNELGHRLVAAVPSPDSPFEFEFFAMADPGINAFALPGGFVGVNMGLILLTQSESELAAVLAHEISHVTQHHYTRSLVGQQRSLLYSLGALALALAAAKAGGSANAGQAIAAGVTSAQALAIQSQLNYTRENEYEADRIGFQRLDAAKFDVNAMATFMERLQKSGRFSEGNAPSYLRTHPVTSERISEAQARAYGKPYRQVPDSLDFQLVRALLRSYQGTPKEAVAYFDDSLAEHKYNNEVAARYGLVASLLRTANWPRAKSELVKLEKMAPPSPMIDAMAGHVYMESGDLDRAIAIFEGALAKYPSKMQLIYDYPEALLKAKRPKDAAAFLERELAVFPSNGPLHRIAARTYAELGKKAQQYLHQGEFYAWQGDLRGAVNQLELASKATDADFYQSSVVETRLRALRRELADQQAFAKNG